MGVDLAVGVDLYGSLSIAMGVDLAVRVDLAVDLAACGIAVHGT